jgi:hypothetical protein
VAEIVLLSTQKEGMALPNLALFDFATTAPALHHLCASLVKAVKGIQPSLLGV